jgi:hypothetical protein
MTGFSPGLRNALGRSASFGAIGDFIAKGGCQWAKEICGPSAARFTGVRLGNTVGGKRKNPKKKKTDDDFNFSNSRLPLNVQQPLAAVLEKITWNRHCGEPAPCRSIAWQYYTVKPHCAAGSHVYRSASDCDGASAYSVDTGCCCGFYGRRMPERPLRQVRN